MKLHIKQGVKSIFRTPKIGVLFCVFFLFMDIILGTSLVSIHMIQGFKNQCKDEYSTIGVFEYENEIDSGFEDYEKVRETLQSFFDKNHEYVRDWDINSQKLGYTPELNRRKEGTYYEGYGVIVIKIEHFFDSSTMVQNATVLEELYDKGDHEGRRIYLSVPGEKLEEGHIYIVNGIFYKGKSGVDYFDIKEFSNKTAENEGFDGSIEKMCLDITKEDGYEIPESADYFQKIADTYEVINNSVIIQETDNLENLYPFHEKIKVINEGKSFEVKENEEALECVISDTLSERLSKKVGDTIELSISEPENSEPVAAYWSEKGFQSQETYKIVGIYQGEEGGDYCVYVPKKSDFSAGDSVGDATLGQVWIENGSEEVFRKEIKSILPDNVSLKIYDQGYHAVIGPMDEILYMAKILCILTVVTGIALILLFGYIYVYRQQRTGRIIWSLGAGKSAVYTYFLSGAGALVAISVMIGSILTAILNQKTGSFISDAAQAAGGIDYRYSNGNLSVKNNVAFAGKESVLPILLAALGIILAVVFCICFFVRLSMKKRKHRSLFVRKDRGRVSKSLAGGAKKYAMISLVRRKGRNVLLFFTVALSSFFMFQLSESQASYGKQLQEFQKDSSITGKFMDYRGKYDSGLIIYGKEINDMMRSGDIDKMKVSKNMKYEFLKISDNEDELKVCMPRTTYEKESACNRLMIGSDFVATNDISNTVGVNEQIWKNIQYADGYDETMFENMPEDKWPCIIPESLLKENGIQFGDKIGIMVLYDDGSLAGVIVDVVGTYPDSGMSNPAIYTPLECYLSPEVLFETEEEPAEILNYLYFGSVAFELKDSHKLADFKDYLSENGYSGVNEMREKREFVVLNDIEYLETQQNMTQKMKYMNVFLPIIEVLLEIIALVISCIMIRNRKNEILLMRKLGTSKGRIFSSILIEQVLIGFAGCVSGILVWSIIFRRIDLTGLLLSLLLLVLWSVGSIFSIGKILRKRLSKAMQEGE